jgi:sugar/nucleoside kinase (ribokinase family)
LNIDDAMPHTTASAPTSFTDVMTETGSGRRTFFHCPGANEQLSENHLRPLIAPGLFASGKCAKGQAHFRANREPKIFCLGYLGFLPLLDAIAADGLNASARLLCQARGLGMLTAADLVSAPNPNLQSQIAPCLPHLDILFSNEWEAGQLLNTDVSTPLTAQQAGDLALSIRRGGVGGAVVLHFPEGAVAAVGDAEIFSQGAVHLPDGEIQGTVGAGDALAAGVLLARHEGMSWPEALTLGVCAAAACLKSSTASDGMLPWEKCLELGRRHGFKEI